MQMGYRLSMTDTTPIARDLMVPDTEPTDEELAFVMNLAQAAAIMRKSRAVQ